MNKKELDKKIKAICHDLRYNQGYISSIAVLIKLNYLSTDNIKKWKTGQILYLEKVCNVNLSKLSLINKTIKKYALELNLKSSVTAYMKVGKGNKKKLIFSKTRNKNIEIAYSTHYIDVDRMTELKTNENKSE